MRILIKILAQGLITLVMVQSATASEKKVNPHQDFGKYAHEFLSNLPFNFSLSYIIEPKVKTPSTGQVDRLYKLFKYNKSYRLEVYTLANKDEKPMQVICYDGLNFYVYSTRSKVLKVGTDVVPFTRDITSMMSKNPLTVVAYMNGRGGREFTEDNKKLQIDVPYKSDGEIIYRRIVRSKSVSKLGELVVNQSYDLMHYRLDSANKEMPLKPYACKMTIKELKLLSEYEKNLFIIPVGSASVIIDCDMEERIDLR